MFEKINDACADPEYQKAMAEYLTDPQAICEALPDEEKQAYIAAQQSVINARRAGERIAHTIFIN